MALKDVFQQFLNDVEWEDEIAHDDSDDTDFISTGCQIDSQRYRLILITSRESSDDQNFARLSHPNSGGPRKGGCFRAEPSQFADGIRKSGDG